MTNFDFLSALINKLNNMESELRLHNLRNFFGISQAECNIGKSWIQHATSHVIQLTTTTGRIWIFRIETRQCLECRLTFIDTVGIITQFLLDTINFLLLYTWYLSNNLYLHFCRDKRKTILW